MHVIARFPVEAPLLQPSGGEQGRSPEASTARYRRLLHVLPAGGNARHGEGPDSEACVAGKWHVRLNCEMVDRPDSEEVLGAL